MKVYFEIDEDIIDGVEQFLVAFENLNEKEIKESINSCKLNPVEIPAIRKGLSELMTSHFAAAMYAIKIRMVQNNPNV